MSYFKIVIGMIFFVMLYSVLENKVPFFIKLKKKPYLRMTVLFIYMYLNVNFLKAF